MPRPTFTPEFEEDESSITARVLSNIDDSWRKEKGDFMYDAVAATPIEVKQLEANQDAILKNAFPQFAEGNYMDLILEAEGMERKAATACKRSITITAAAGVSIALGQKLSTIITDNNSNPIEYTVDDAITFLTDSTLSASITCRTAGTIGNIPVGSQLIFSPPIAGITAITDVGITTAGTAAETDEEAWTRYQEKKATPSTGGNKNDYVTWATAIDGVGKAKCIPRWNGVGTVKVIIVDNNYLPASDALVLEVQNVIDPGSTGNGDGKAPAFAQTTVAKATQITIDVSATVTYVAGYDVAAVKTAFTASLTTYLKQLALVENSVVDYNKVNAYLTFTEGVSSFASLLVNGGTANVAVGSEATAIVGTVTV